jgi:hypothetical protein
MKPPASIDADSLRTLLETPYTLDSITRTASPIADDTRDWHSYVIAQGTNRIVGHRPGTEENVRLAAEQLVARLNERRNFRTGRNSLILATGKPR